jgi:hypothetical protein
MRTRRGIVALLAAAALGACVPYPNPPVEEKAPSIGELNGGFPGLGEGGKDVASQHFVLSAYGEEAQKLSDAAEVGFTRLLQDVGLVTFLPIRPYKVVVYGTQEEYKRKTAMPDWSLGVLTQDGIYTYQTERAAGTLSHLMTQAVVLEYLNGRVTDQQRWVLEGLATYEEFKTLGRHPYDAFTPLFTTMPLPVDQLENMAPVDEREYETTVWYGESYDLIRWMIERGGKINFTTFLNSIKDGQSFDAAVASAYPGMWTNLAAVFNDWQRNLQ